MPVLLQPVHRDTRVRRKTVPEERDAECPGEDGSPSAWLRCPFMARPRGTAAQSKADSPSFTQAWECRMLVDSGVQGRFLTTAKRKKEKATIRHKHLMVDTYERETRSRPWGLLRLLAFLNGWDWASR